ncbi:MAG: NosD domain-containing protein [Candidatus Hatepunaea meridiana]|nr:NosD domain-containing protein [Candidatus Hatepunaea meridiana]
MTAPTQQELINPGVGDIDDNAVIVWDGRIRLEGDVSVPSTSTLVINPGTVICSEPGTSDHRLIIEGTLIAEGNEAEQIYYQSTVPGSQTGGIRLETGSSTGSIIKYLNVTDAKYGVRCAVNLTEPISNNKFEDCYYGTYLSYSSTEVSENEYIDGTYGVRLYNCPSATVSDNSFDGMSSRAINVYNATYADISDNTIIDAGYAGIYFQNSYGDLTGNDVTNCARGIVCYGSSPKMIQNTMSSCTNGGLLLYNDAQPMLNPSAGGYNTIYSNGSTAEIPIYGNLYPLLDYGHNNIYNIPETATPFLKMITTTPGTFSYYVRYNYWAESSITLDPYDRFDPYDPSSGQDVIYLPLEDTYQTASDEDEITALDDSLKIANEVVCTEDNERALAIYNWIVESHPMQHQALTAMGGLFVATKYDTGDVEELIDVYQALADDYENARFTKHALDYVAYCQVELGEYEEVIEYYESIILDAPSVMDSIYAIIDLGAAILQQINEDGGEEVNGISSRKVRPNHSSDANSSFTRTLRSIGNTVAKEKSLYSRIIRSVKTITSKETINRSSAIIDQFLPNNEEDYERKVVELLSLLDELDVDEIVTDPAVPDQYFHRQNYPNPFNSYTNIDYGLPENSNVEIIIYDVIGREVKTVVNEKQKAGYYSAVWKGDNSNGITMSSGIYFCKITASNFENVQKITMIK